MLDVEKFVGELHDYIGKAIAPLLARIKELEARQPEKGEPGEKGDPGEPGKDADPVEITHEDILVALKSDPALMREVVADYLKDNPPPAGKDGRDGVDGKDGADGKDGRDGEDGAGATGAMIDKNGELILTLGNGELQRCGVVVGKDGAPGKDGRDLTDLEIDLEDERTVVVRAAGETVKRLHIPTMIDRGYWRKGNKAQAGDCYTWDGSLWCAQEETDEQPGPRKKAWRLVVRKGKDGTTVVKYKDDSPAEPVKLKKDDETDD